AMTPEPAGIASAAISPDGRTVATASKGGAISFVDLATGDDRRGVGPNTGAGADLAFSPNGRSLASAANNAVTVWNPQSATPRHVLTAPGGAVQAVAFAPDGRTLYTSSIGGVVLEWDLTGTRTFGRSFALGEPSPCCNPVAPLAPPLTVSPDG